MNEVNEVTLLKRKLLKVLLESLETHEVKDDEGNTTTVLPDAKVMTVALGTLKTFLAEIEESVTVAQATALSDRIARFTQRPLAN